MFVALWQYDRENLLAGLLLFRLLYYIIPFALALTILGIRELLLDVAVLPLHDDTGAVASEEKKE
jgi:glycosyltransferase 2 family protein